MRDLVRAYKVLADESRLRVLNLLLERECCVCEVVQVLDISQSKASRILNSLYDAGFLKLRREGLWSLYSIDRDRMGPSLSGVLETTRRACEENEQMAADRYRLRAAERIGPGCAGTICRPRSYPDLSKA